MGCWRPNDHLHLNKLIVHPSGVSLVERLVMEGVKTVCCLLCNGLITLVQDEDRFALHMKSLHDVFFNLEFLRAASLMDEVEKDAVIDVMKTKMDGESLLSETSCQEENSDVVFNDGDLNLSNIVQIKKVTVDIPIYKLQGSLSEIPPNAQTTQTNVKTKIFICNYCGLEFPSAFQSLADHKMKIHKLSKRDSQIITMKHVRYEDISDQNKAPPILDKSGKVSPSDTPDLSDMFTDIFKPKSASRKTKQVEKSPDLMTKIKKESDHVGDQSFSSSSSSSSSSTCPAVKIKQERCDEKKNEDIEMQEKLELIMAAELKKQNEGPVGTPEVEPEVTLELEPETPQDCVLCNLKISSESKLKLHMARRHLVPEERFHLFDDGGKSLFKVRDTQTSSARNTCKLCDQTNSSLGSLWNHYKKHHNMTKDTIKSLITKTKCLICFSHVTFIKDHYRTFHNQEGPEKTRHQRSGPGVGTPVKHPKNVVTTEKTPRKSNEENLAKIWESVPKKSPSVSTARNWSNIFDYKSSRDARDSEPAVANSDNIFAMDKERETSVKAPDIKKERREISGAGTGTGNSKAHNCTECGKQFQSMRILRNHLLFHRAEIKNARDRIVPKPKLLKEEPTDEFHFCDYCEYSSVSESDFKKHVESRHKMEVDRERSGDAEALNEVPKDQENVQEARTEEVETRGAESDNAGLDDSERQREYAKLIREKLIDKLRDLDDSDEEEEEEENCDQTEDQPKEVEDTEVLESLNLSQLPRVLADNLERSEYFRRHQSELSNLHDQRKIRSYTADPPLGLGWRVRYFACEGGGTIEREFLSPHNIRLSSAEAVVEYITCSSPNTSNTLINNIKFYLGVK